MLVRLFLIFFLIFLQKIYSQECFILNYGEGVFQKNFINEIKKIKNPYCSSYKEIKLTGDDIIDRENLQQIKEGIVFCLTDNAARFCKELKKLNVIGLFISREIEYSKNFKVLSFYPNLDNFFKTLKDLNLNKILIIFSTDSSEKALHIFAKAKEKGIKAESIKVENMADISFKVLKIIKDYDAILIPVDKTYFDKEIIKMLVEIAHKEEKKLIAFLDLFLSYGVDYSFQPDMNIFVKEAIELLNKRENKGIFEISEIFFKEKRGEAK